MTKMDVDVEKSAPLLSKIKYVDGCPGCKLQIRNLKLNGRPPKKDFFILALLVLTNSLPMTSLFPYLYFLVRDLHVTEIETNIGFYAGFIGSSFMLGRFVTSTLWGVFADKYGRKPTFYISTVSIIVFMILFGFSTSFWMAIITRFLLGSLNGMVGPSRAYASEVSDKNNQALGLSVVGTMWGVGLILGPAIGGFFVQPSLKYPTLFPEGSFFDQYQYLLPNLVIAALSFVTLLAIFSLPETLHKHPEEETKKGPKDVGKKKHILAPNVKNCNEGCADQDCENAKPSKEDSIWKNRGVLASIALYSLWSFHLMAYSEVFSLWAVSPLSYGGLALSTSDVGTVLAITGAALLTFQLSLFPPLAKAFGAIMLSRMSAILTLPLVLVFPLFARLEGIPLWIAVITASILKNLLSICVVTGSLIMTNNSVSMKQRGLANGMSMTSMSFFKAVAPTIAGSLFALGQKRINAWFLPGNWMVFVVLAILCLFAIIVTFEPILPKSVDEPKPDYEPQEDLQ